MRSIVLAAALAVVLPRVATAQPVSDPSGPDTYLELQVGGFIPQHRDLEQLHAGGSVNGVFGARFNDHLSVEGGAGYYRVASDGGVPGVGAGGALWAVPLTASVRLRQPFKAFEVSALGGAGFHLVDTRGGSATSAWGFHVGGQAAFNLSPVMLMGVDVRRTFVEARIGGVDLGLDGLFVSAVLAYRL
jgi:hypothetical protein